VAEQGAFFSVWAQDSSYWLVVEGPHASQLAGFAPAHRKADMVVLKTDAHWREAWVTHTAKLASLLGAGAGHRAAVIASETLPSLPDILEALRPFGEINAIAANVWLIEAINHGKLDCYMQRVMDRRGKQVGYEAFARMENADGGVIGGGAIMQAAHALRIEYQLDRLLHKQAIESFVASDLEGYVFINFLTGFIHRPEVYLDGLSQAVNRTHVRSSAVVLDVPLGDYTKDMAKLKSIAQYCRTRGFSLALDDVAVADGLAPLLTEIRPAFVKLDPAFDRGINPARAHALLHEIVQTSHAHGVMVLAEGVENAARHSMFIAAEVDMFQGYLFGAPERFPRAGDAAARADRV
jgi:EAL domain-containing protein (putative c-di-GMP-specific phosphodiesterase class I)